MISRLVIEVKSDLLARLLVGKLAPLNFRYLVFLVLLSFFGKEGLADSVSDSALESTLNSTIRLSSSDSGSTVIELYSSQGCSSCPPAERWLNDYVEHPLLWEQFIPINFHVDYWDFIGWRDPFAKAGFSQRQRRYQQLGASHNVATPGFVVDGRGWNGWFRGGDVPRSRQAKKTGSLQVELEGDQVFVSYQQTAESSQKLSELFVHVARLGVGIETQIKRGENAGRTLRHDFVVTGYRREHLANSMAATQKKPDSSDQSTHWQRRLELPATVVDKIPREALVVWVSTHHHPEPIQITAGWM